MLNDLKKYSPGPEDAQHYKDIMTLVSNHADCFYRTHFNPGHITGSALLLNADGTKVLMNHHKFLNIWICFGGHADGETNVANVALREAVEESGIENIVMAQDGVFDVDVHDIPKNVKKNEPPHKHFDIRYLVRVADKESETFHKSHESNDLRWCDYAQATELAHPDDASMHRLLRKWQSWKRGA